MKIPVLPICAIVVCSFAVHGEEPSAPARAIQDNSFFVEEAYNQEAGVVQHILTMSHSMHFRSGEDDHDWELAFTQEWPLRSQRHQVSYSIPYLFTDGGGRNENGFGDMQLDYRLQALFESDTLPAVAPRIGVILPTGDRSEGLGEETFGYQLNVPVSKVVHDRWTVHANAGLTGFPDIRDRHPVSFNVGASVIYALHPDFNLMLEFVGDWVETVDDDGDLDREFEALLSPGFRYAFNRTDSQWVVGVAVPVGLTSNAPDVGVFLYVSFEHLFSRAGE